MKKRSKRTKAQPSSLMSKLSLTHLLMAVGAIGGVVAAFLTVLGPFSQEVKAIVVTELPAGNSIQNPWFRSTSYPNKPGLDSWIDAAGTDVEWSLSQKDSNPSPDAIQGTSARWAFGSGQGGGSGIGGEDAFLYQIVTADPANTTLWFKTHWVTGYIEDANAKIYASNTPDGPWELVWTPLAVTQTTSSNMAWTETGLLSTQLESGYEYYKVEFQGRYPANRKQGFKFTGVYFMSNDGTFPETGGTIPSPIPSPTPEASPEPSPSVEPTPSPTPAPTVEPSPTPGTEPGNATPVFTTEELSAGSVNKRYLSRIDMLDADSNETLNVSAVNLPGGLSISACQTAASGSSTIFRCRISGTPTTVGTHYPEFTVTDSEGASATRIYPIVIQ